MLETSCHWRIHFHDTSLSFDDLLLLLVMASRFSVTVCSVCALTWQRCGPVVNWKRVQGANGKLQGNKYSELLVTEYWSTFGSTHITIIQKSGKVRRSWKYFSEILGFIQLFWMTYLRKVHILKTDMQVHQTAEIWTFEVQISPY